MHTPIPRRRSAQYMSSRVRRGFEACDLGPDPAAAHMKTQYNNNRTLIRNQDQGRSRGAVVGRGACLRVKVGAATALRVCHSRRQHNQNVTAVCQRSTIAVPAVTLNRLPLWQVALLTTASICILLAALHFTAPLSHRLRARSTSPTSGSGPTCFPLSDTERVKLIGAHNKAAHRQIQTASKSAQVLFDLGMLQTWGFERSGATDNFNVRFGFLGA